MFGWLYQFKIELEKKNQESASRSSTRHPRRHPALHALNWIVQYLVQNGMGRLWLMAKP